MLSYWIWDVVHRLLPTVKEIKNPKNEGKKSPRKRESRSSTSAPAPKPTPAAGPTDQDTDSSGFDLVLGSSLSAPAPIPPPAVGPTRAEEPARATSAVVPDPADGSDGDFGSSSPKQTTGAGPTSQEPEGVPDDSGFRSSSSLPNPITIPLGPTDQDKSTSAFSLVLGSSPPSAPAPIPPPVVGPTHAKKLAGAAAAAVVGPASLDLIIATPVVGPTKGSHMVSFACAYGGSFFFIPAAPITALQVGLTYLINFGSHTSGHVPKVDPIHAKKKLFAATVAPGPADGGSGASSSSPHQITTTVGPTNRPQGRSLFFIPPAPATALQVGPTRPVSFGTIILPTPAVGPSERMFPWLTDEEELAEIPKILYAQGANRKKRLPVFMEISPD